VLKSVSSVSTCESHWSGAARLPLLRVRIGLQATSHVDPTECAFKDDKAEAWRRGSWAQTTEGPSGPEIVVDAADTAIDSSVRSSFTAFDHTMSEWRDILVRWRCNLPAAERVKHRATAGWDCRDLKFLVGRINLDRLGRQRAAELNAVPTRFKLTPDQVETVVVAGRDALRTNPTFRAFLANP
jgi:NTE family protein